MKKVIQLSAGDYVPLPGCRQATMFHSPAKAPDPLRLTKQLTCHTDMEIIKV